MKNKAKLSISRPQYFDGTEKISISVTDADAHVEFLEIEIELADMMRCLTGGHATECWMETRGLDVIGKMNERMNLEFEMPEHGYSNRVEVARKAADKAAPEGWSVSGYFGSQNSFFERDGVKMARTTMDRWVEKSSAECE